MMDLINELQKEIIKIYISEDIKMLVGINNDYLLPNGKQILMWNGDTISNMHIYEREAKVDLNLYKFKFYKNLDNLLFTSDEIAYFTANAFLYKDRINDPIKDERSYFDDKRQKWITYYPNFQNLESKRYSMFIAVAYEKIYNYWDRLGDLLWATYFQNDLKEIAVDFSRVVTMIEEKYPSYNSIPSFVWLMNYKNTNYKSLNDIRKNIVHYTSIDIEFKSKHLEKFENNDGKQQSVLSNRDEVQKIMDERRGYLAILKTEINYTIEGFIKVHELIEEITTLKRNGITSK
jgi:hypothetical protein